MLKQAKQQAAAIDLENFTPQIDALEQLSLESTEHSPFDDDAADISATVTAFNRQIQEKKKAQEIAEGLQRQANQLRHSLLLQALSSIRRSLTNLTKVDLGERFSLVLKTDDYHGWPRLSVQLLDNLNTHADYPILVVEAEEGKKDNLIKLKLQEVWGTLAIPLNTSADLKRLPAILKKNVREYLDQVGEIVLLAERNNEQDEVDSVLAKKSSKDFQEAEGAEPEVEISGDLFDDSVSAQDIFERLTPISAVESLPGMEGSEQKALPTIQKKS